MTIDKFDGDYAFLSNFYEAPTVINGITYPTNEHFFQAMKTEDPEEQRKIAEASTPGQAKRLGRAVKLRDNWDSVRIGWMKFGLEQKFSQHPELAQKLIDTGNAWLIEGNTWHDTFWGQCDGVGQNNLGALLMALRDELKNKKYCHWDENDFMPCERQAIDCESCTEYYSDKEEELV